MPSPPRTRRLLLATSVAVVVLVVLGVVIFTGAPELTPEPDPLGLANRTTLEEIEIAKPEDYWSRAGYVRMVPPVRLPSGSPTIDQIEVWLKLPAEGEIDIVDTPNGPRFLFPPGTVSDRVEYVGEGDKRFVGDVRGTRFGADGHQRFRVLRPERPAPGARLWGFEWVRDNPEHKTRVDTQMIAFLGDTAPGKSMSPEARSKYFKWFRSISDCAGCHPANKPTNALARARGMPNRATDANGMYTPATVFANETALEAYRPHDRNRDDPFVRYDCPEGEPTVRSGKHVTCPEQRVPTASFDMAAALAGGSPHAQAVCRARNYLYKHLSQQGRRLVAQAMDECAH